MAHIMRRGPGEDCHDYACGSAGCSSSSSSSPASSIPQAASPLRLCGQELQAESYAVAHMNAIIHGMEVEIARGDTMINPSSRPRPARSAPTTSWSPIRCGTAVQHGSLRQRPIRPIPYSGRITTGKGDWAWLQHTLACLNEHGRAAVVLETGAVTRGSGSKNEDKERNIPKWFVDRDLIDGVILLPGNLFYNTSAAGVIVVLSKRKPAARKGKIVLVNASRRARKGRPKNFIPEEDIRPLATTFLRGKPVEGEVAVITHAQAEKADYNLSPSRWVTQASSSEIGSISTLLKELVSLDDEARQLSVSLSKLLVGVADEPV